MGERAHERKRKDADEEEGEVSLPVADFDPRKFMRKEVESAKLAVLNTSYGILLAGIAGVAQALMSLAAVQGWLVLVIGVLGLRPVYSLAGVSAHEWSGKEWLGAIFTLFFTFLAFWYIFSNPPFI